MRLRTKFQDEDFNLGEVVEANVYYGGNGRVKVIAEPAKGGMITFYFESLKGLNEMFEDYKEPKEHWIINSISGIETTDRDETDEPGRAMIEIGNYFETREEAEKAVECLRAWKRLKDKGFRFKGWNTAFCEIDFDVPDSFYPIDGNMITNETEKDLDLLFGGEE